MHRVTKAKPYMYGELGSTGRANLMLLAQYDFPDTYSDKDHYAMADHDRVMWGAAGVEHGYKTCKKHTGTGELGLGSWIRTATSEQAIAFLVEFLRADTSIPWTGYRVMGTVNRSNGFPVFTLELFCKIDPATEVYSGENAPNVERMAMMRSACGRKMVPVEVVYSDGYDECVFTDGNGNYFKGYGGGFR